MTDKQDGANEELTELEVVELASDDGSQQEFVILDRLALSGKKYALMATVEDMENMESMTEEEFEQFYGSEDGCLVLMVEDGESYYEVSEEEYEAIKDDLQAALDQMSE